MRYWIDRRARELSLRFMYSLDVKSEDFSYDFDDFLTLNLEQTIDRSSDINKSFFPSGYITPAPNAQLNDGFISESRLESEAAISSLSANYIRSFDDFKTAITLKYLYEKRKFSSMSGSGYDFIAQGVINLENTVKENQSLSSEIREEVARNYFLNLDIDYKDKIIDVSIDLINQIVLDETTYDEFQTINWIDSKNNSFGTVNLLRDGGIKSQVNENIFLNFEDIKFNSLSVIDLNLDGNINWQHSYGDQENEFATSIAISDDGSSIFIAGSIIEENTGTIKCYVLRIDSMGNLVWDKVIESGISCKVNSIENIGNVGFILTGMRRSPNEINEDLVVIKIDTNGELIWERTYGGNGVEAGSSIKSIDDGGFIISGYTDCLLYTSPSPRDRQKWRMPASA